MIVIIFTFFAFPLHTLFYKEITDTFYAQGSSIMCVTALGKWGQGFCDISTQGSELVNVLQGRKGVKKALKIALRHLWTTTNTQTILTYCY